MGTGLLLNKLDKLDDVDDDNEVICCKDGNIPVNK